MAREKQKKTKRIKKRPISAQLFFVAKKKKKPFANYRMGRTKMTRFGPIEIVFKKFGGFLADVDTMKWLDAQDAFVAHGGGRHGLEMCLEIACLSRHPDAMWFSELFSQMLDEENFQASAARLAQDCQEGRACFFASFLLEGPIAGELLERAAVSGYSYAYGILADRAMDVATKARWARVGAALGDRRCLFLMSRLEVELIPCDVSDERVGSLLEQSAKMGYPAAMWDFSDRMQWSEKDRWHLKVRALKSLGRHQAGLLWINVKSLLWKESRCGLQTKLAFFVADELTRFGIAHWFVTEDANELFRFHERVCGAVRSRIIMWILCVKTWRLHKDVRMRIAKMVWNARGDLSDNECFGIIV